MLLDRHFAGYGKKTGNVFENGPFISTFRTSKIVKACLNRCYDVLPYTARKNIFMSWKVLWNAFRWNI